MKIDHIEVFVPNREVAAAWYASVFGFHVVDRFRVWSLDKGGPLMISADDEQELIALFEGEPQGNQPEAGFRRLAFRLAGREFMEFIQTSSRWSRPPLRTADIKNHTLACSIYFSDPYGNRLEVTTYDVDFVSSRLNSNTDEADRTR